MGLKSTLLSVLSPVLFINNVNALLNINVGAVVDGEFEQSALGIFCTSSLEIFDNEETDIGHFREFNNGVDPLLSREAFLVLCGPLDFEIANFGGEINAIRGDIIQQWVTPFEIFGNPNVDADDFFNVLVNSSANEDNVALRAVIDPDGDIDPNGELDISFANLVNGFNAATLNNLAATSVSFPQLPRAPGTFCASNQQCIGNRNQNRRGPLVERDCERLGLDDGEGNLQLPTCNDYVASFNLRWLLFFIMASYVILILWAMYWTIPAITKKLLGKGKGKGGSRGGEPEMSPQDQVLINTLASQCAATENILLMATDFVKQAKGMQSVLSVEAKRESKIMIYVCEYFQVLASVLVALTHDYLHKKTFIEGEAMNIEDATTRALQIEVLNYIRARIQLAMNSDSMTDKSLIRLAEALAIMQKVTESLTFVGFTIDRQFEDSLGTLRTPKVEFTEDSFFLGGIWKQINNTPGMEQYENSPVCITINGADTKGLQRVGASLYLNNVQKDCKNYSKAKLTTQETVGKALSFSSVNSGERGEGSQDFIRSFWGPEISALQAESKQWVSNEGALESWLDQQRLLREQAAQPVVTQASGVEGKGRRRRRRRRQKENQEEDVDDKTEITEATEATEQSGWTVDPSNNFVFNVKSVAAHGLGIAGKPSIPFDKPNEKVIKKGNRVWNFVEYYFPNFAAAPKFYTFFFIIMPIVIIIPWMTKIGKGAQAVDIDGNVAFKARAAGFGTSYLGVPGYYFLDARVPEAGELEGPQSPDFLIDPLAEERLNRALPQNVGEYDPFDQDGAIFVSNVNALAFFENDWDGSSARRPDEFLGELQGGILAQENNDQLDSIRNMQKSLEVSTMFVYGLMHIGAYFFGMVPLTLIRESLEILARRFPIVRSVYPLSQWRELHMTMGLSAILFVVFGATVFLITQLVAIQKDTPFVGLGGDPNIPVFFNFTDNVLYIRQVLLPAVPLLLLMKYASRGPPRIVRLYAPRFITMNYWEICYFLHYFTALTAIIVLVIYRAQVFYWMGTTWGIVWGGNIIVRILRTRKTTIRKADLISYTVEDSRNNAKKRSDVLRITLNVPSSFPSSARGQACWITCPEIDLIAHPFTLAKTPDENEQTIMFHIAVKYLPGDDIIEGAKPTNKPAKAETAVVASDPNALPPGWKAAVDPSSGQTYYYNSAAQKTTWTCPTETAGDKMFNTVRGITSRFSANFVRGGSSALWKLDADLAEDAGNARNFVVRERATWTQKFAALARYLQNLEPHLRANTMKNHPIYVSAPLGTSMDEAIKPSVPGSMIITTQNGLPAAESCVRWLLTQPRKNRPVFFFFVSVIREVNDAVAVLEMLREAIAEAVVKGYLNIDGVNGKHAHMLDWLCCNINVTRRKASQIMGDRNMLMRSLNPPKAQIDETRLAIIDEFIANRVNPGRLQFDRFLVRSQQMVLKRTGDNKLVVAYCGSGKVATSLRSACRKMKNVHFDGEYI